MILKVLKKHAGMRHSGGVSIDRHMEHLKLRTLILHRAPKFRIKSTKKTQGTTQGKHKDEPKLKSGGKGLGVEQKNSKNLEKKKQKNSGDNSGENSEKSQGKFKGRPRLKTSFFHCVSLSFWFDFFLFFLSFELLHSSTVCVGISFHKSKGMHPIIKSDLKWLLEE